jgi:hypothetical protein
LLFGEQKNTVEAKASLDKHYSDSAPEKSTVEKWFVISGLLGWFFLVFLSTLFDFQAISSLFIYLFVCFKTKSSLFQTFHVFIES